ncbi:response regulator transcription factor [Akkermansiaceae bacterium]|nr:response regulator transcription factor [Akkermansiaceae bacterium]
MRSQIKVMLVEDNREYREVIRLALQRDEGFQLTGEYGTAEIALRNLETCSLHAESLPPLSYIILLDLQLPGMSGLEALTQFVEALPEAKIIVLTQSDRKSDVLRAIALGADGYLLKSSTVTQIKEGMRTVIEGGASLDPTVAKFLLESFQSRLPKKEIAKILTDRETEILHLIGEGLLKKEICERLGISYPTVDSHVRHIYEKLMVHNAPAAITVAHRLGIFPLES